MLIETIRTAAFVQFVAVSLLAGSEFLGPVRPAGEEPELGPVPAADKLQRVKVWGSLPLRFW